MLSNSFKWKHYEGDIILLNVRWYLKYPLSYRNLKEMRFRCKKSGSLAKSEKTFTIRIFD
jgi:transposase-like protein